MIKYYSFLFLLLASLTIVYADVCTPSSLNECNAPISEDHQGAVQLCSDCFVCGADDGICPEDYATGEIENRSQRMYVPLKVATDHRPSDTVYQDNNNINVYDDGNIACESIMGDCNEIQTFDEGTGNWTENTDGVTCSTSTTNSNFDSDTTYRAFCENVMQTASCGMCSDPDCLADIKGFVFADNESSSTDVPLQDAFVSTYHEAIGANMNDFSASTNKDGFFEFDGKRGLDVFFCGADDYEPKFGHSDIIRGDNIVDCTLEAAVCGTNCTKPNRYGELICNVDCDDEGECSYPDPVTKEFQGQDREVSAKDACQDRELGTFARVGRINNTHVGGFQCCTGQFETRFSGSYNIEVDSSVNNLITREYSRVLDEDNSPVRVVIITYD